MRVFEICFPTSYTIHITFLTCLSNILANYNKPYFVTSEVSYILCLASKRRDRQSIMLLVHSNLDLQHLIRPQFVPRKEHSPPQLYVYYQKTHVGLHVMCLIFTPF
jgi:hypothetical protein